VDYQQTLNYLIEKLPMFHRIGAAAYKANLDNINSLCDLLNHPEKKFRSVHIAGTNGKGSVSHMLASVLMTAGYKTGLFTSPHLKDFRERIRINGIMITQESVIDFVEKNKDAFEKISPSFFEWTTALAFDYFAHQKVDIAVIETGLGGRLDSTNIIYPELSVITNISNDHKNLLGNTLEEIAGEKAGIIKENIPVVIGERQKETAGVLIAKAQEKKSVAVFASDNFSPEIISSGENFMKLKISNNVSEEIGELQIDLPGLYQQKNICTVLQSLEILKKDFTAISRESIESGLSEVIKNTGLRGRWEMLSKEPLTIADVGHNEEGIRFAVHQLSQLSFENLHIVFGLVNDKETESVLKLLPDYAIYYFCRADLPRAMNATELMNEAARFGLNGKEYSSVKDAYSTAKLNAGHNDVIFIGGSTFVVAEVI
jgi:dihydrofolate synthase/folylpolyglutamate synthase